MKMQSNRQLRAANLIREMLVGVLQRNKHLELPDVTITKVVISSDLRVANCYLLPFAGQQSKDKVMAAYDAQRHALRRLVTEGISLKFSPELRFFYDHGLENAFEVERRLQRAYGATDDVMA